MLIAECDERWMIPSSHCVLSWRPATPAVLLQLVGGPARVVHFDRYDCHRLSSTVIDTVAVALAALRAAP